MVEDGSVSSPYWKFIKPPSMFIWSNGDGTVWKGNWFEMVTFSPEKIQYQHSMLSKLHACPQTFCNGKCKFLDLLELSMALENRVKGRQSWSQKRDCFDSWRQSWHCIYLTEQFTKHFSFIYGIKLWNETDFDHEINLFDPHWFGLRCRKIFEPDSVEKWPQPTT